MNRKRNLFIVGAIIFEVLIMTLTFNFISKVRATTCESTACSNCDGCCWNCSESNANNFRVTQLPYRYTTPSGACLDSMDGITITQLPFWVDGVKKSSIPADVTHNYCKNRCDPGPTSGCEYELIWWKEEE